jgi:peptidoglycan hydrolase-like protein with peptidoglycan-binding domain
MRKKLLLSTAALLAGVAIASAQEMPGGKSGGAAQSGAQMERGSSGASHEQGRAGQAQRGAQDQSKQSQSQQRGEREQTTGQAKQGQHDQIQMQGQRELGKQGQAQQRREGKSKRDQTTGQSQRGQESKQGQAQQPQQKGQAKRGQQDHTTGQAPQRQQSQGQQGQTSGQTGSSATGQAGSVNLTQQQRTHIQQTVLAGRNVPRVDNVNFSLSVGTVVPSHVRVVAVPPTLIEINPAWRGHQYFVVRDEIIIVDRGRKVIAAVPVGSSGAQLHRGGASSASAALDLRPEQIREIQMVLKEKGFAVEIDGRLGSRTRQALIAFQRKQGLTASGRIDNQTVTALGVSDKIGAQGGATTGQGNGAANQGKAAQQPSQQNQGAKQPSTSGQGSANPQQKPAQENKGASQPSTNGQGGAMKNQAPVQQNQGANKPSTTGQSSGKAQEKPAEQSGSSK